MTLSAAPTTSARRPRAASCVGGRAHTRAGQNKFAYGCNGCSWGKRETKGEEADWNTDAPSPEIELVVAFSRSGWERGREKGVRTISMSHESDTGGGIMPCSFRLVATAHGEIQRGRLNAEWLGDSVDMVGGGVGFGCCWLRRWI